MIALSFLFLDPRAPTGVATQEDAPAATANGAPLADPPTAYVIDLNTGEVTPLPLAILNSLGPKRPHDFPSPGQFAASPDGSLLAYVGTGNDGSLQIFIAGLDGTGVRQVTHHPTDASSPDWSPDGAMIAYDVSGGLFVLDVATGGSTQVPDVPLGAWGPQFTPDGSKLLYTGLGADNAQLWTVPIDGGISTVLVGLEQGMGHAGGGSMSPDGSLVIMLGHKINGPGAALFLAETDGSEPRNLGGLHSGNCRLATSGTWSPDGRRIVCAGGDGVLVVDVATGESSRVADGTGASWLDDHTLLVEA
jgi:Tol biopolymer transport system component